MHPLLCLFALWPMSVLAASSGGDFRYPRGTEHFVTRPEIMAPRLMMAKHHPESITPGYWFVTPYYVTNQRQRAETKEWIPCQTGAHIYDGDGQLVWSGACKYDNRNIFAFQPVDINGTQHLSFWLGHQFIGDPATIPKEDVPSSAVLLNNHYEEVTRVFQHPFLDCHEVSFQPDGKSILLTRLWKEARDLSPYGKSNAEVLHGGFRELDLVTNEPIFDWDPVANNVTLDESCDTSGKGSDVGDAWDYFHINSIDKNADGDYLISARHTSTIYKISGVDGRIIWRLGGYYSDFEMEENLPFHWQHHAKLLHENETHSIVSVFDNAGDDFGRNPDIPQEISAGKIMLLETAARPMKAKMLRRFDRPDGSRSPMGGSVFLQGDDPYTSNVIVNWVIPGYFSEYDAENRLVFEGKFDSEGIKTYRAFKSDFAGHPLEPIAFKVFPYGYSQDEIATAFFVSWNGATEVHSWSFYGRTSDTGSFKLLGNVKKRGFETSWIMPGAIKYAYVAAHNIKEEHIASSTVECIEGPPSADGNYQITIPVLEDAKSIHGDYLKLGELDAEPSKDIALDLHDDSAEYVDAVIIDSDEPSQDVDLGAALANAYDANTAFHSNGYGRFVVDAFAVFGVVGFLRSVWQRYTKRRSF